MQERYLYRISRKSYRVVVVEKVELGRATLETFEPHPRHLSHHPLELELSDVDVDPFFGLKMLDANPEPWLSIFRA